MSESCEHKNPLQHGGTTQAGRVAAALDPSRVELHGLTESDWLEFAYNYARQLNYYKEDNPDKPAGDWQHFFKPEGEIEALLNRDGEGDTEPHMALFISFLKLLTYPQKQLNELPKRHLDFYYQEILKIQKKPVVEDRVHVLFELAKNASDEFLEPGTSLNAGKDSEGNLMSYSTTTPLVVNHGRVAALKTVYVDNEGEGDSEILRFAETANSADGTEEEFEEGENWSAFGNPNWPAAQLAFYISSDLLLLREGTRTISLKFKLRDDITVSKNRIRAFLTGESEWIEATITNTDQKSAVHNFIINLQTDSDTDPISFYSEEVHSAGLPDTKPALKVIFTEPGDYQKLKNADISELELRVKVEGARELELKNELGNIDPEKPFMPFGSKPKVGSRLSVRYPELSGKPVSNIQFEMQWLNTPSNFSQHYSHYKDEIKKQKDQNRLNASNYGTYLPQSVHSNFIQVYDESVFMAQPLMVYIEAGSLPPDDMKPTFKAELHSPFINESGETGNSEDFSLFSDIPQVFSNSFGGTRKVSDPKITFTLKESFYHDLYSKLYVNAVLVAPDGGEADLPNEPYTPLLDSLTLNYTAREKVSFSSENDVSSVMYHQHPFGVKRAGENPALVPGYSFSEMYIGLEGMQAGSNISLLFQVAEGTEDPLLSTFNEGDIDWWVLSDNKWLEITEADFARNQTNNFLTSGIAELALPKEATKQNSLLPQGIHWLRIRLKKKQSSVSRFINVHAQAAEALFQNFENSLNHLNNGLPPESIGKLKVARAAIKTVMQPYASYGGKPEEDDDSYYRRVSERLRHKNRAVSIWDYEHLVLEQFPSLYKVKCLNHCHWDGTNLDEMSPGNVTVVVIPRLAEDNTSYRLEPRVSRNFLNEVEEFLNKQNSIHARLTAANAVYEPVRFEFEVEFRKGLDFNFHKKQIIEDLRKMVAPWVFDDDAPIEFGGSFSEYQVVHYIEKLSYVNYISNFKMFHKPLGGSYSQVISVQPSVPIAILVPAFDEDKIHKTRECD